MEQGRVVGVVEPLEQAEGEAGVQARGIADPFVGPDDRRRGLGRQGKLAEGQAAGQVPGLGGEGVVEAGGDDPLEVGVAGLAQGARGDAVEVVVQVVRIGRLEQLADALQEAGGPPEYVVKLVEQGLR